jgi:protein tyrosine phosphatase
MTNINSIKNYSNNQLSESVNNSNQVNSNPNHEISDKIVRTSESLFAGSSNITESNLNNLGVRVMPSPERAESVAYHGVIDLNMNRPACELNLQSKLKDNYVIRRASIGGYALSIKVSDSEIEHFTTNKPINGLFVCNFEIKNKDENFKCSVRTVEELQMKLEEYLSLQKRKSPFVPASPVRSNLLHGSIEEKMDRNACETYLKNRPNFSYIIRESQRAGYALSIKTENNVFHYIIQKTARGIECNFNFMNRERIAFQANSLEDFQIKIEEYLFGMSERKLFKNLQKMTIVPECIHSNDINGRFGNIHCPLDTAVEVNGKKQLHANFVHNHKFIATQAPMEGGNTQDFWRAASAHAHYILDLTSGMDKIKPYYPIIQPKQFEKIEVSIAKKIGVNENVYTVFDQETNESHEITRFHFKEWIDFGVIGPKDLGNLVDHLEEQLKKGTVLVHCRAGVGRTGVVIAASIVKWMISKNEINPGNLDSELIKLVVNLRMDRGPGFIQTAEQLNLVREYARMLLAQLG